MERYRNISNNLSFFMNHFLLLLKIRYGYNVMIKCDYGTDKDAKNDIEVAKLAK